MNQQGFTVLELLLAVAIAGVIASVGFLGGKQILQKSEQSSAIKTLQQSIWQGATAASARGVLVDLEYKDNQLILQKNVDGSVIRTFELPSHVSLNKSDGTLLQFLPPGEISEASLNALITPTAPLLLTTESESYAMTLSLIGEVKAELYVASSTGEGQ